MPAHHTPDATPRPAAPSARPRTPIVLPILDGDGAPDAFDVDDDGDGVPATRDLSPFSALVPTFSEANLTTPA